ncbi:Mitochondrial coenzyme A transporter [Armadillidium nasatum]|uniref:Mitochondrial coenzyme A transporter n=1 Tax=Armadillidium nasatum TaxID=96803 RepID=A0A5N5TCB6_9CRUS|nr:Mitochondrial coenzyme A transporter [Armadillidium nasatum]
MIDKDLKYSGLIDVLRKMYFNEGFLSLWKGLSPSILMAVPSTAIQFRMYTYLSMSPAFDSIKGIDGCIISFGFSYLRSNLCLFIDIARQNIWGYQITKSAVCGITAGVCAKVAVYPLDVLKKRMQIRGSEEMRRHFGTVVVYENIFDCVWKVTYHEGPISWFKGLKPSLIKSGAFSGLIFIFYEMFRETILTYKEKSLTKS